VCALHAALAQGHVNRREAEARQDDSDRPEWMDDIAGLAGQLGTAPGADTAAAAPSALAAGCSTAAERHRHAMRVAAAAGDEYPDGGQCSDEPDKTALISEVCGKLLDTDPEPTEFIDEFLLQRAAQRNLPEVIRRLLELGFGTGDHPTATYAATAYSFYASPGVDVPRVTSSGNVRDSALECAAKAGHTAVCQVLVAGGADPSALEGPLTAAIACHDDTTVRNI